MISYLWNDDRIFVYALEELLLSDENGFPSDVDDFTAPRASVVIELFHCIEIDDDLRTRSEAATDEERLISSSQKLSSDDIC